MTYRISKVIYSFIYPVNTGR